MTTSAPAPLHPLSRPDVAAPRLMLGLVLALAAALSGCGRDGIGLRPGLELPDTGVLVDATVDLDGGDDSGFPDATFPPFDGGPDSGPLDIGFFDAGLPDLGFPDSGVPDSGLPDSGLLDGAVDGGSPDGAVDGGPVDTGVDGGVPDSGLPDSGLPDTGVDGGRPDTGLPDTGLPDSGLPDTGLPDTGVPDTGVDGGRPDTGLPDTGLPDTGLPDANVPDGGSFDGGTPDGGVPDSGVSCPAGCGFLDDDCNVGVCAPDGITCLRLPRPPGTACNDGDLCTSGDRCRAGRCIGGAPVDCSSAGDQCNTGVCDPSTGSCSAVPVLDGTPCDDNVACTDAICVGGACLGLPPAPPPGDTCLDPVPVIVAPGSQVQSGDTSCASDDLAGQCGGGGAPDLIFDASAGETRRLRIETVQPSTGASFDTVLYVNDAQCMMPSSQVCDDDGGQGFLSLIDQVFTPGARFVVVDGFGGSGPFELLIETDPHDTCARPSVLPVPALNATVEVVGNTSGNANDFQASCAGSANSADQVWVFNVSQPVVLRFETLAPAFGAQFDTALHIRTSCTPGNVDVIACDDDAGNGTLSKIERTFDPGTYFLVADGFGGNSQGEYRLAVTQLPPLTPFIFPATGDARQPLMGPFSIAGEFVEGIRNTTLNSVTRMEVNLQVVSSLTCAQANFRVRLNNTVVGNFLVRPGDTAVNQVLSFSAVTSASGRYNIRYELATSIPANCGAVELPDDVSSVGLGP